MWVMITVSLLFGVIGITLSSVLVVIYYAERSGRNARWRAEDLAEPDDGYGGRELSATDTRDWWPRRD